MNYFNHLLMALYLLMLMPCQGQNKAYVTADSGLTIRDNPDVNARKIGKLHYGEALEIIKYTNQKLVILDNGQRVAGEWVRITTPTISGFVFDGYLSEHKVGNTLEFHYPDLDIKLKDINPTDEFSVHTFHDTDSVTVTMALGDTPENKTLVLKNKGYKHISIFQSYETSITVMNEGPHCDLTEWQHYCSEWLPLQELSNSTFKTLKYSEKDRQRYVDVDLNALKREIRDRCGEDWYNYIEKVNSVNDYPLSVAISRILLKILITENDDSITEKIIVFEIPMGC